ncbi:OLC1v1008304C2 [Oldenlandia corymbosa var. corymbosa]|uniref:OLC1v1008304C2 n=1 Tax=Oldenlandia corymbosa var. corymbosa TaxID=529605 RepID=A0AAV1DNQ1_OLDCO|nr:OLC1v1008304C2 [Oldenlandia corymbosa var. corymbosa]
MTRPMTEAAITELYNTFSPKTWCIADLGCSSGPNTFMAVFDLIKTVDKRRKSLGLESPEYQVFLNDLPTNDFNTIFKSVPEFQEKLRNEMEAGFGQCFVTGVPGSFYQRLFPSRSLHFVYSSYSLHWISKVPEMEEANKGNIHMANSCPASVIKAYVKQFEKDFSSFLSCRSEEIVTGGRMVLTLLGRKNENPCSKEGYYHWELLAMALREMVSEVFQLMFKLCTHISIISFTFSYFMLLDYYNETIGIILQKWISRLSLDHLISKDGGYTV